MELRFNWRFAFALFVLTLLTCEGHEQAHIQFGGWACQCYGERDFSLWGLRENCAAPDLARFSSLAGPAFTYLVIWLGAGLVRWGRSSAQRAVGLALVFAPLPFARIFTVLMGSGDEVVFLRSMLANADSGSSNSAVPLAMLLVFVSCIPPIVVAWRSLDKRRRGLWIAGLCILPMLAQGFYIRLVLNKLLALGFLAAPSIAGSPAFVLMHTALAATVFVFVAPWLLSVVAGKKARSSDQPSSPSR